MQDKEITIAEIIHSLEPLNNGFFHIDDLAQYAAKVLRFGKAISIRNTDTAGLLSYILYYDNGPQVFISMVWTHPDHFKKGLASNLLQQLIDNTNKDIVLEVDDQNPARFVYQKFKFRTEGKSGKIMTMRHSKRLSVMQPYVFPYIGYFHLIEASDQIVFYDDVNYIKKGWINRNRILLNGKDHMFTIPVEGASQFRSIHDTIPLIEKKFKEKFFRQIESAYKKAPFYNEVSQMIFSVINGCDINIADLAINSIIAVYAYLGTNIKHNRSSLCSPSTKGMDKADRLIRITKDLGYHSYINLVGGKELYNKTYFEQQGIELHFVQSSEISYKQFLDEHVPWLSVIDVLMFNDKKTVLEKFRDYHVI